MLLGAGSIVDMNRLRDGALTSVIGQVRAPSTLGSFLRAFEGAGMNRLERLGEQAAQMEASMAGPAGPEAGS